MYYLQGILWLDEIGAQIQNRRLDLGLKKRNFKLTNGTKTGETNYPAEHSISPHLSEKQTDLVTATVLSNSFCRLKNRMKCIHRAENSSSFSSSNLDKES